MRNNQIRDIAYMGMYLALFFVFDWLSNTIGLFQMPNGGSLGLSVIPLLLCSYHLGWKKGTAVCLLCVLMMFMTGKVYVVQNSDGFAPWQVAIQFLMEYPVAFGIYGLASLFPNFKYFYSGVAVTNLVRLALHVVAGTVFWATPWWGSFTYNAWYMIPTMIMCLIVIPLIYERLKKSRVFN
ncbi:MAG: energy-coupled thiamine transporter ThiT [Erysipelotrichaceae bacterium]|nr:energy-coupled thiamine transporter ThiT [Erysipelotrichaceae bacterium]